MNDDGYGGGGYFYDTGGRGENGRGENGDGGGYGGDGGNKCYGVGVNWYSDGGGGAYGTRFTYFLTRNILEIHTLLWVEIYLWVYW